MSVQQQLAASDYVGALELIATTQSVLREDLKGVLAMRHMQSQLDEIQTLVEKVVEADFNAVLLDTLKVQARACLAEEEGASERIDPMDLRSKLYPLVLGLLRLQRKDMLKPYWAKVESHLRGVVKDTVTTFLKSGREGDSTGASSQLASWGDSLRDADQKTWMQLLELVFNTLVACLQAMRLNQEQLYDILTEARYMHTQQAEDESTNTSKRTSAQQTQPQSPEKTAPQSPIPERHPTLVASDNTLDNHDNHDTDDGDLDLGDLDFHDTDALAASSTLPSTHNVSLAELEGDINDGPTSPVKRLAQSQRSSQTNVLAAADWDGLLKANTEVLKAALNETHLRCSKLVQARVRDGADVRLALPAYLDYLKLARRFIAESSTISGYKCPLFEATVRDQVGCCAILAGVA
jgi:vacuolar protein sorting-associated protein 54